MLLAIDVGNTQTHVGAFDDERLVEHWRFSTDRQSTGDELAVVIHDLLALRGIEFDQIHGEVVSSVVPRLVSEYRYMFERYLDREALILGPGTKTGMPILLENPHELGPDRLAGYLKDRPYLTADERAALWTKNGLRVLDQRRIVLLPFFLPILLATVAAAATVRPYRDAPCV